MIVEAHRDVRAQSERGEEFLAAEIGRDRLAARRDALEQVVDVELALAPQAREARLELLEERLAAEIALGKEAVDARHAVDARGLDARGLERMAHRLQRQARAVVLLARHAL